MNAFLEPESDSAGTHEAGMARYLREVGRSRLLSHAEERLLLEKIREGNRKALNDLVTANLKWVVAVCSEYRDQGLSITELIAEGNLGLIRAALGFDPDHAFRFTAYAIWWIRQSLERALAEQSRFRSVSDAREPEPAFQDGPNRGAVLDRPLSPEIRRALEEVLEPGRTVLKLFFGLDSTKPMSLESIGQLLGLDLSQTLQLKDQALRRLQKVIPDGVPERFVKPHLS